jgi:ElaB/YqjD/DUF883 family membrane-anchored ribosome-binding protein
MPTKAAPAATTDDAAAAAENAVAKLTAEAQRTIADAAKRIDAAVQEGLVQLRAQSRVYADRAGEGLDEAQQYVTEQVRARPLAAMGAALGVGVLIGMLLGSGRR